MVVTLVLFAAFGSWLLLARVPVYAASASARLEVADDAFRVEAAAAGALRAVRVRVGDRVEAGQELFEIAGEAEHRRLEEEKARQHGLREQLKEARLELVSRRRELVDRRTATAAELAEEAAVVRSVRAAADLAADEADRAERLYESGLVALSEVERLRSVARQRRFQAEAADRAVDKVEAEAAAAAGDLQASLAQRRQQVALLEGQLAAGGAAVDRLTEELERRSVRAPAAGVVAELSTRRVGSQVEVGDNLATIVPDAELRAVASFEPAVALGRVREGQRAEIRLDSFPWTEFGSLEGRVARVSTEPRDGLVRVELALPEATSTALPLRHGLPGDVLVQVDETTPLSLVLRSVGHRLDRRQADER